MAEKYALAKRGAFVRGSFVRFADGDWQVTSERPISEMESEFYLVKDEFFTTNSSIGPKVVPIVDALLDLEKTLRRLAETTEMKLERMQKFLETETGLLKWEVGTLAEALTETTDGLYGLSNQIEKTEARLKIEAGALDGYLHRPWWKRLFNRV